MPVHVSWDTAFTACASKRFADAVNGTYESSDAVLSAARIAWWQQTDVQGWLEAFAAHPRLGDAAALRAKFAHPAFGEHSQAEQAAALATGTERIYEELAALNEQYESKFGHIFIMCASGRSAHDLLACIKQRITATPYEELGAAAREQMKITEMRLLKALNPQSSAPEASGAMASLSATSRAAARTEALANHIAPAAPPPGHVGPLRSPITTHVLDAALGAPAQGVPVTLMRQMDGSLAPGSSATASGQWDPIASEATNEDGRIGNLLPAGRHVAPGTYRMCFDTGAYLLACRARHPSVFAAVPFYPRAYVDFTVTPVTAGQHFHIPLLLSPYSFSTYRGS